MAVDILSFPPDFRWGTATASHQVEGQLNNDWSEWERLPGKIRDGSDSGRSCEWWAGRYEEDFGLAQSIHQNALRLSLEWSRIEPEEGIWDDAALSQYRRMLGTLREDGMEPMVTLFHFTNPLWLVKKGGWENPEAADHFEQYTVKVVQSLGDLANVWCTINEANVYAAYAYLLGLWPPQKSSLTAALRVLRHLLLAHMAAYRAIHALQSTASVGLAQHVRVFDPFRPGTALDRWAAHLQDLLFNELVLTFPASGVMRFPLALNELFPQAADSQDYIGLNYYSRDMVAFDIRQPGMLFGRRFAMPGAEFSMNGWGEIYPEGLYRLLRRLQAYGKPVLITEAGLPDNHDSKRPKYLLTHLAAVHRALREGVPVKGFYFWSLVDNFEWAEGFSARFGLVHLDPATGQRTMKRSGELYAEICRAGGITRDMVQRYAPEALRELSRELEAASESRNPPLPA